MAAKVILDAMIPRADFAATEEAYEMDLFQNFPIGTLDRDSPIRPLLRKPDFQRETNHWTPQQQAVFIASFLDNELIPALILWKSPRYVFVIDGGHRLSALRSWMEDDYGDGDVSRSFYKHGISSDQLKIARRARKLIEHSVGKFSTLKAIVRGEVQGSEAEKARASRLFTRALALQWVQGNAAVAESSFFKINSQGTPLDDTEEMLLRNRRKSVAVAARAVVRAATGHKYWSAFSGKSQEEIEHLAAELYGLLFDPELETPIKTLDLPLGGTTSPVDALSLLIEFFTICDQTGNGPRPIEDYADDSDGNDTIRLLKISSRIMERITGNSPGSLGLHPAVYFYNERGKHSRFLFLGMVDLIAQRLRNNDDDFFKRFTSARERLERFLLENKSLIGIILQNTNRNSRVYRIRIMFEYLVGEYFRGNDVSPEGMISILGVKGRFFDITTSAESAKFSDDAKSEIYISAAVRSAPKCPICKGLLFPLKSVSYDHLQRVREGGFGDSSNGQMTHPYCNSAIRC